MVKRDSVEPLEGGPSSGRTSCRTGCVTKDHGSYVECLRASRPQVQAAGRKTVSTERDLIAYADARRQGVQPEGTSWLQSTAALRVSEAAGAAYDATDGSFKS